MEEKRHCGAQLSRAKSKRAAVCGVRHTRTRTQKVAQRFGKELRRRQAARVQLLVDTATRARRETRTNSRQHAPKNCKQRDAKQHVDATQTRHQPLLLGRVEN